MKKLITQHKCFMLLLHAVEFSPLRAKTTRSREGAPIGSGISPVGWANFLWNLSLGGKGMIKSVKKFKKV